MDPAAGAHSALAAAWRGSAPFGSPAPGRATGRRGRPWPARPGCAQWSGAHAARGARAPGSFERKFRCTASRREIRNGGAIRQRNRRFPGGSLVEVEAGLWLGDEVQPGIGTISSSQAGGSRTVRSVVAWRARRYRQGSPAPGRPWSRRRCCHQGFGKVTPVCPWYLPPRSR